MGRLARVKKNPLKNQAVMVRLNPFAKVQKRIEFQKASSPKPTQEPKKKRTKKTKSTQIVSNDTTLIASHHFETNVESRSGYQHKYGVSSTTVVTEITEITEIHKTSVNKSSSKAKAKITQEKIEKKQTQTAI